MSHSSFFSIVPSRIVQRLHGLIIFVLLVGVSACSDDTTAKMSERPLSGSGSLYAVMYEVFTADDSDSYLSVFDSLDIEEIDTKNAREFGGGRAFLQVYNDWIFVGEPATPIVRRFSYDRSGKLTEEGEISFANYGLMDGGIDDWGVNFISPTKAYFLAYEDGTTIIWNPTEMTIEGEIPAPAEYVREGFTTSSTTAAVRGNRLFRSIFWESTETTERSQDQLLLVYDTEKDEFIESAPETRCPGLSNRSFEAEDGTWYFSNWIWPVADTLLYGAPKHCVLRIQPDSDRFDPEWSFTYADVADGREGAMFTYLADGKGLASIFHDENIEHDETTDPWDYAGSPNWELWNVDIEARTGSPVSGVPLNTGAFTPVQVDERAFVMIPDEGWENTQLYEVDGDEATPKVSIPGWSYMLRKLR